MEQIKILSLLNLEYTNAKSLFEKFEYPFEVLPFIGEFILDYIKNADTGEYNIVAENILIHKTAKIAPTANINAPCVIGENTEVRHCAFIRGNAFVGKNCVVGNSTELKNIILFDNVQVPHYNYVGDSILGYKSHMGAGSITSNVKSDSSLVSVKINGKSIETGLKKFGAILGDFVEIGCNSVLNPGSIVGRRSNIYPLSSVRGFICENHIYKNGDNIVLKK